MPSLSTFYGLIVWMYKETDGKHNLPHIHVQYGDYRLAVSLDGQDLEGSILSTPFIVCIITYSL